MIRTGPRSGRWRTAAIDTAAALLLLTTPFVVFVQHHRYPWRSVEVLTIGAGIAAMSVLLGAITSRWPLTRAPIFAVLVALLVDVQFTVLNMAWIAAVFVAATALLYLLRERSATLIVAVTGTILATSLVRGAGDASATAPPAPPGRSDLPLIVHMILDEQIGIEGVPADLAPNLGIDLRTALEGRGFAVFGGAYSQYFNSHMSISHLVNFIHDQPQIDVVGRGRRFPLQAQRNAYFETMSARGYRIRALLPDYLGLCPQSLAGRAICDLYSASSIKALANTRMPVADRIHMLFGSYRERMTSWRALQDASQSAMTHFGWEEPTNRTAEVVRMSAIAADLALSDFAGRLAAAQPGDLHLAHVLLPHYPYVFGDDCQVLPVREWVHRVDPEAPPGQSNTPDGRAARYPAYAAQVRCAERRVAETLEAIPAELRDRTVVIMQGDHGSRLGLRDPVPDQADLLSDADLIDAYSTLFAIRAPSVPVKYDARPAAIACLLKAYVDAEFRDSQSVEACFGPAHVFLAAPNNDMVERALPDFHYSEPGSRD